MRTLHFGVISLMALLSGGCTTVAQVGNLTEGRCRDSFESAVSSILREQNEHADIAQALAHQTYLVLANVQPGPRPFAIAAPSGTDYLFFAHRSTRLS